MKKIITSYCCIFSELIFHFKICLGTPRACTRTPVIIIEVYCRMFTVGWKMDGIYFALKTDSVANKIDSVPDAYGKSIKLASARSVSVTVRAGSLWQRIDGFNSADDTYEPIAVVRNSTTVLLRSCEQDNVRLTCSPAELYRLNSEIEFQLLLAVEAEDERLKLLETDDGHQLQVGRQIWAAWKDQQQGRGLRSQSITDDIRVFIYGKICGTVRYVGHLSGRVGLWFGVELLNVSNVSSYNNLIYCQMLKRSRNTV